VTISERLQAELTAAMRSGDSLRRDTLRMAVSAVYNARKEAQRDLSEDEEVTVLAREVKRRREAVDAYAKANRTDLAEKEEAESRILAEFMPEALSEDELRIMVQGAIDESGATSARDLGKVMSILAPRTRGRAEGRVVSGVVAQELAKSDLAAHEPAHQSGAEPAAEQPKSGAR
jgi:uncharacterized protein YqeY